jgi:hypothetical protein
MKHPAFYEINVDIDVLASSSKLSLYEQGPASRFCKDEEVKKRIDLAVHSTTEQRAAA